MVNTLIKENSIVADGYKVKYNPETKTINFHGSLRLNGSDEYSPILQLLNDAVDISPSAITLNLEKLEFLNSSGINALSKFVISMRKKQVEVIVQGSKKFPWQSKSLKNLQRLLPSLKLEIN
ncbi:MAG: STAS domain-containing protein [Scytonema sp. RU_4_4]|nr:STAS domain-containing protein [Scytonema sp. RU_4_4]NJR74724.1 STAS domain-containing protein [Scytonema sp. CRU_2_7]